MEREPERDIMWRFNYVPFVSEHYELEYARIQRKNETEPLNSNVCQTVDNRMPGMARGYGT